MRTSSAFVALVWQCLVVVLVHASDLFRYPPEGKQTRIKSGETLKIEAECGSCVGTVTFQCMSTSGDIPPMTLKEVAHNDSNLYSFDWVANPYVGSSGGGIKAMDRLYIYLTSSTWLSLLSGEVLIEGVESKSASTSTNTASTKRDSSASPASSSTSPPLSTPPSTLLPPSTSPLPTATATAQADTQPPLSSSPNSGLKIGLGVGLGLGLPVVFLASVILACVIRRRRYSDPTMRADADEFLAEKQKYAGVGGKDESGGTANVGAGHIVIEDDLPEFVGRQLWNGKGHKDN